MILKKCIMFLLISVATQIHAADKQTQLDNRLFNAIERKASISVIISLVRRGADVNARNANLSTPSHRAAYYNRYDCIEVFVKRGADLNTKNRNGNTPLHDACRNGSFNTALVLLYYGVKIEEPNIFGTKAMIIAQTYGYPDIVECVERHANFPELKEPDVE